MFTCTLEAASKTPLCEQLYTALKREMERGGIRPGERMPSKRELAAHLTKERGTRAHAHRIHKQSESERLDDCHAVAQFRSSCR